MRFKIAFPKVICFLGGLALLVPLIVYAAIITANEYGYPNEGSGPPISGNFTWLWNVQNPYTYMNITAWAYPNNSRLRRERSWYPDETVWQFNYTYSYGPELSDEIPPGSWWAKTVRSPNSPANVMSIGNNYHWDWSSWSIGASDEYENITRPSGRDGTYRCVNAI